MSGSRKTWIVAGPHTRSASMTRRPSSISSGSWIDRALDRLAPARLEHRARNRVQAAPAEVAEAVDRQLGAAHRALDHRRLGHVVDEEPRLRGVVGEVDRARAGAPPGLDHDGVVQRVEVLLGQHRRRGGQAEAAEQQVGLVLVIRRARDLRRGHERGQPPVGAGHARASRCRGRSAAAPRRRRARRTGAPARARTRGPRSAARRRARAPRTGRAPAARGRRRSWS